MKTSDYFFNTQKETPAEAEIISHQLMLRTGMIRKLSAGLYSWLPLGLRVLRKVERIVRQELDKIGAHEILMPAVQPAEIWQETGRWEHFNPPLLKMQDRHARNYCFGPTHEEVVTDVMRQELRSYKQLPVIVYQIQSKFRDELRPRSGVMRAREFLMKDAYSFHETAECLQTTYEKFYGAYRSIFQRLNLDFRAVLADTGAIGGSASHEFHVLAKSGEDHLAYSDGSDYAANVELASALRIDTPRPVPSATMETLTLTASYDKHHMHVAANVPIGNYLKTIIVKAVDGSLIALVLRADHELNEIKLAKISEIAEPLQLASHEEILEKLHCAPEFIGPQVALPLIVDFAAAQLADFSCAATKQGQLLNHVNWGRDLAEPRCADLRKVVAGDLSPDGKGHLQIVRGIEVGHIFQLGTKYSQAMQARVLNEQGQDTTVYMGCYGIGVSRIVAAAIEQNNDENGIIWPDSISPFHVVLLPMNMHKAYRVQEAAEKLYAELTAAGFDVLFDDRKERPGVMFATMDLIGIPHRIVIGERGIDAGTVEYKNRRHSETQEIAMDDVCTFLRQTIKL